MTPLKIRLESGARAKGAEGQLLILNPKEREILHERLSKVPESTVKLDGIVRNLGPME